MSLSSARFNRVFVFLIILSCAARVSAEPITSASITGGPELQFCQSAKLLADDGEIFDVFGVSVSVSGDVALVGAHLDDDNGENSGSAYVFRWKGNAWFQEQKLLADDGASRHDVYVHLHDAHARAPVSGGSMRTENNDTRDGPKPERGMTQAHRGPGGFRNAQAHGQGTVDCNANAIPDNCDIHCGAPGGACDVPNCGQSLDCNENSIPDDCEIAANASVDCDGDGVLSECEFIIADRDCDSDGICNGVEIADCPPENPSCADCNTNQIPDACDIGHGGGFPAEFNLMDLGGSNGFVINGIDAFDESGTSVSSAGDVNHDGIDDVIIGAPSADPNGQIMAGKSYVVFGRTGVGSGGAFNLSELDGSNGFVINGIDPGDQSGSGVSSAGDVNHDGIDDVIIGAPSADPNGQRNAGESYVVFGAAGIGGGGVLNLSELDGSNGFVLQGLGSEDSSGTSVSSAGDVNNDGIDDLVIGATGRVYVVFGRVGVGSGGALNLAELDGANGFVIISGRFGFSVSSAGDVNNDGIDDLIILGSVIFGGPDVGSGGVINVSELDGSDGFVIDAVGSRVSSAGDVNDDGIDDLLIGDPQPLTTAGKTFVIFGGADVGSGGLLDPSELDGSNGFVIKGIDTLDLFGAGVSSAGDFDNDGIDDIIIGARLADPNNRFSAGASYVVFGHAGIGSGGVLNVTDLDGTIGFAANGIDPGDTHWSVSLAGDVNNDGIDDVIIGAPRADPNDQSSAGESYVVFGRRVLSDCNINSTPDECDIASGVSRDCNSNRLPDICDILSGVSADCNVNGVPDSCDITDCPGELSCSDCNENGVPDGCEVVSFSHPTSLSQLNGSNGFVIHGIDIVDFSGWSVSSAGDLNNDGIDDLILGAPGADPNDVTRAGESYVVFGDTIVGSGGVLNLADLDGSNGFVINGIAASDESGSRVSSAGDVNNDGIDDLVIGANAESYVVFGRVDVGSGGALNLSELDGANGFVIVSGTSGLSVSSGGDVNNDGIDDLIVGGSVIFGGPDVGSGGVLNILELDGSNGFVISEGVAVSSAGDVNNDGIDDLIIGGGVIFGGTDVGSGGVFNVSELDGRNGFLIVGEGGGGISSAGDVNSDGIDDLIKGAPYADPNGLTNAGQSYVIFGGPGIGSDGVINVSELDGSNGFVINGIDAGDQSGHSVSSAGDVNNDGIDDLIIGAPFAHPNDLTNAGESYVVYGAPAIGSSGVLSLSELDGNNGFVFQGIGRDDWSGFSVSSAGDVNNDGFDDLIIGAPLGDFVGLASVGESYVVFGRSVDCNSNGIPDECDLNNCSMGDPACADCNNNNDPDECDIRSLVSGDCNEDHVPDDCEVPQTGAILSEWVGENGLWDDPPDFIDWCMPESPDNNTDATFDVTIASSSAVVTINTSPTIDSLSLLDGASIQVDDKSGANVRTLSVDDGIINTGVFRATDRERLVLDSPTIFQGGVCGEGGVLEATDGVLGDGEENDRSVLEINGARVVGGIVRTIGEHSEIHLIGGAELVDVCIDGVVVPDGQTGGFSGTLQNNDVLTIRGENFDTRLEPTLDDAVLDSETGTGCVRLTSQAHARLGDFKTAFRNSSTHRIEGAGIIVGGMTNDGVVNANRAGEELIIFPPGQKVNNGLFEASGGGGLRISTAVSGSGAYRAEGGTIRLLPNGGTASIAGATLDISNDEFENPGVVEVAADASIDISGAVTIGPGGEYRRYPNAQLTSASLNAGSLLITGGPTETCISAGAMVLEDDMVVDVTRDLTLDGGHCVNSCRCICSSNAIVAVAGGQTPPVKIVVRDRAVVNVSGDLTLVGSVETFYGSDSLLSLEGNFVNELGGTPEAYANAAQCFSWEEGQLLLAGSSDQMIEVSGQDLGRRPQGFESNFAIGTVEVSDSTTVSFVDSFDNDGEGQTSCSEVFYVDELVLGVNATVIVDHCRVYYQSLIDLGAEIVLQGDCAAFVQTPCTNDVNLDLRVDSGDYLSFALCMESSGPDHPALDPACIEFHDVDADGDIDMADWAWFQTLFTGP